MKSTLAFTACGAFYEACVHLSQSLLIGDFTGFKLLN